MAILCPGRALCRPNAGDVEHHGWGDVGHALRAKVREGDWASMRALVSDEMLEAFVPTGGLEQIAGRLRDLDRDIADGISLRMPADSGRDEAFREVISALRVP